MLVSGLLGLFATNVAATALTYNVEAHEKACFYADTKKDNEKVAFYFAVSRNRPSIARAASFLILTMHACRCKQVAPSISITRSRVPTTRLSSVGRRSARATSSSLPRPRAPTLSASVTT